MLNLTFFAQIINFWFAYLLLERILLRKLVALVRTEKHEVAQAESHIVQEAAHIEHQKELIELTWQEMQQTLQHQQPHIMQSAFLKVKNMAPSEDHLGSSEKQALITILKKQIVKELAP